MATFLCKVCRKKRPLVPSTPGTNTCLRCKLQLNNVLLHRIFKLIVEQPEMQQFKAELEEWYSQ